MRNIYTVAQVNTYIKNMFSQDYMMHQIGVRGEVSNCKYHSSGHIYFTLKDKSGTIACVMFAGNRSGLSFPMETGQQVVVLGSIEVYERDGKYQLYAKQIILDGAGAINARLEKLKKELEERGMFAPEYKQPIPKYVGTLGVVTAKGGAAVRDIIAVAKRRNPYIQILVVNVLVQGENAPRSIVNGIRALEQAGVDAMIIGRGGGSSEDLDAFNEEIVAQTIFDCSVPIVSAVGHEINTTIADLVADLRAATPSAAAELAVADVQELLDDLSIYNLRMLRAMQNKIGLQKEILSGKGIRLNYLNPLARMRENRTRLMNLEEKFDQAMELKLQKSRNKMALMAQRLKGASPVEKLCQGFSYAADSYGKTLLSVKQIEIGDEIEVFVQDGLIKAQTMEVIERDLLHE